MKHSIIKPKPMSKHKRSSPMQSLFRTILPLSLLLSVIAVPSVYAETENNPCAFVPVDLNKYGGKRFKNPPVKKSKHGHLTVDLNVKYATHKIAGCEVTHRSYNGQLVGPTLVLKPGDTLNVNLANLLPPDSTPTQENINIPHHFNITNLHTHGLHVSPVGNSDNILLNIKPGNTFQYEVKIPKNHAPGTFWYHAHIHGSTALQVGSGMVGTLIIKGGLDKVPAIKRAKQKVMVFEHISHDEEGKIEDYSVFGPGVWETLHRPTLINGQLMPVIYMKPGEVQRWRLVHGGVRETIMLKLQGHKLHEIATDGIATGRIDSWDTLELQPGYRSDVLVQANNLPAGVRQKEFYLIDAGMSAEDSLEGITPETEKILAKVIIKRRGRHGVRQFSLPSNEDVAGMSPFEDIRDEEITGTQESRFSIRPDGNGGFRFMINETPFDPNNIRKLTLGDVEEWKLSTSLDSLAPAHPFHIHVNPFQVERTGPNGLKQKVWKDTLMVRAGEPQVVRTRYEKYIGTFMQHCHILDHEDQGMMELIEIVNP